MFNMMHPTWVAASPRPLSKRMKIKIFKVSVCMMARCGSEAWTFTEAAMKKIRGWCCGCLVTITSRTCREEAKAETTSFDMLGAIRVQRLK